MLNDIEKLAVWNCSSCVPFRNHPCQKIERNSLCVVVSQDYSWEYYIAGHCCPVIIMSMQTFPDAPLIKLLRLVVSLTHSCFSQDGTRLLCPGRRHRKEWATLLGGIRVCAPSDQKLGQIIRNYNGRISDIYVNVGSTVVLVHIGFG